MSSTTMHPGLSPASVAPARQTARDSLAVRLLVAWFNMRDKQRSRRQLGELDARLLRDIGVDRASAAEEAARSIWR